jgi:hypothetical protein
MMPMFRRTHERLIAEERRHWAEEFAGIASRYGKALEQVNALQKQLGAWITGKTENGVTPEQFAAMFWANDNRWQAAFFNALQKVATDSFEALPPAKPNEYRGYLGVPAGESQWCYMADDLDESGFETLEAMFEHAKSRRERCESAAA